MTDERYDWDRVEYWLDKRGVNIPQLANALGLTKGALYHFRSGELTLKRYHAMSIAYHLDITLEDLAPEEVAVG